MTYEITEMQPPHKLVSKIADDDLPFGGRWTYELRESEGGGTRITITENGKIYNPIYRFMARYLFGYHATLENYLKALGMKFGEEVSFEER